MLVRARRWAVPLCIGSQLIGCASDDAPAATDTGTTPDITVLSDFRLTLRPVLLDDADPFEGRPQVSLLVTPPDGETTFFDASNGGLSEVGPLEAGTRIGVLVEDGGEPGIFEPERTLAYGDVVLDEALAVGEQDVTLEVAMPPFGDPGTLYETGSSDERFGAGVAMLPDGTTYIFGGFPVGRLNGGAISATNTILKVAPGPGSEPEELDLKLPEVEQGEEEASVRAGLTATTFERDGETLIFVAGGRPDWGTTSDSAAIAHIFDPASEAFIEDVVLPRGCSDHYAVRLDNGDILLDSGFTSNGRSTVDTMVFHPDDSSVDLIDLADGSATLLRSGASLGDDGALICGGALPPVLNLAGSDWPPTDVCVRLTLDGEIRDAAPLPRPLVGHTMTTLPNGDVLVTGGTDDDLLANDGPNDAVDAAYVYDAGSDEWDAVGDMASRRIGHVAYAQPGGHVIVAGGVDAMGTLFNSAASEFASCAERFDLDTQTFTELGCRDLAGGAFARVASSPDRAALVFTGFRRNDDGLFEGVEGVGYASLVGPPSP